MSENQRKDQSDREGALPDEHEAEDAACISRYREEALQETESLQGNLMLVNSGLMKAANRLQQALENEAAEFDDQFSTIELMVKVSREIERMSKFTTRHELAEQQLMLQTGGFRRRKDLH